MVRAIMLALSAGILLVVLSITLSLGAKINTDIGDDLTGTAKDVSLNGTEGLATLGENQDTIATVIVAVVVIGLLLAGFGSFVSLQGAGGGF